RRLLPSTSAKPKSAVAKFLVVSSFVVTVVLAAAVGAWLTAKTLKDRVRVIGSVSGRAPPSSCTWNARKTLAVLAGAVKSSLPLTMSLTLIVAGGGGGGAG